MITENLGNKIKKAGLVLSVMFGLLVLSGITVNAQYRDDDDYYRQQQREQRREQREREREARQNGGYYGNGGYGNGGYNNYGAARQYGFQDGQFTGSEDGRRNKSYNPQRADNYERGTHGYDGRGYKDAYKQAYRQAFIDGYARGYNQYRRGGYGNNGYYGNSTGNRVLRGIFGN